MRNRTFKKVTQCQQCRPVLGLKPGIRVHTQDLRIHGYEDSNRGRQVILTAVSGFSQDILLAVLLKNIHKTLIFVLNFISDLNNGNLLFYGKQGVRSVFISNYQAPYCLFTLHGFLMRYHLKPGHVRWWLVGCFLVCCLVGFFWVFLDTAMKIVLEERCRYFQLQSQLFIYTIKNSLHVCKFIIHFVMFSFDQIWQSAVLCIQMKLS